MQRPTIKDVNNNCNNKNEKKWNSAMGIADFAVNNVVQTLRTMDEATYPGQSFSPGVLDVICARGSRAFQHEGNRRFRDIVTSKMDDYSNATSKVQKSMIVSEIVDDVRQNSPSGGFVKEEKGRWFEVGDDSAREKVGQLFRDLLHTKYRSSTKAKRQRLLMTQGKGESDGGEEEGETVGNISVEAKVQQISRANEAGRKASSKSSSPSSIASCSKMEPPNHYPQQPQHKQQGSMHEEELLMIQMKKASPSLLMRDTTLSSSLQAYENEQINLEPIDFEDAMNGLLEPMLLLPDAMTILFEPEQQQQQQRYPWY